MNVDVVKEIAYSRNITDEWVQYIATNLGESKDNQEVLFTKQAVIEPYNPVANDKSGTGGSANPIDKERPSDKDINGPDLQTRGAHTAQAVTNQVQQSETDHVEEFEVGNIVQGLMALILEEMRIFINMSHEKIRTDKDNLRNIWEDVSQATPFVITAACLLFIKQPATPPRVREILRKKCCSSSFLNDDVMLKLFSQVVIGLIVTHFLRGSSYRAVLRKPIQYNAVLSFRCSPMKERQSWSSHLNSVRYSRSICSVSWCRHLWRCSVTHS